MNRTWKRAGSAFSDAAVRIFRGRARVLRGAALTLVLLLCGVALTQAALAPRMDVFFGPDRGVEDAVLETLASARRSVYLAMVYLSNPAVADALIEARARGVEVFAVFDDSQRRSFRSLQHGVRFWMHGIPVRYGGDDYKTHSKFAVVDSRTVLTGSYNWTRSAEEVNVEDLVRIGSRRLARIYQDQFVAIWDASENPP